MAMTPYRELAELTKTRNGAGHLDGGWWGDPIGRNNVWRLRSSDQTIYVKWTNHREHFDREVLGLQAAHELAEEHSWVAAAESLYVNPDMGVVVTSGLRGAKLSTHMRNAYRVDRNPLRRTRSLEMFRGGLQAAIDWLGLFHDCSVLAEPFLYDHTVRGSWRRLIWKLERTTDRPCAPDRDLVLQFIESEPPNHMGRTSLVCGDAGIGNFLWDGEHIGRIDFEDLGFGLPARDFVEVREDLAAVIRKPWYWSTQRAIDSVPLPGEEPEHLVYALEWAVDRHWPEVLTDRWTPSARRLKLRIDRTLRRFLTLAQAHA